jgi:hypothetical protein
MITTSIANIFFIAIQFLLWPQNYIFPANPAKPFDKPPHNWIESRKNTTFATNMTLAI